jgi:hypothetical protein
VLCAVLVWVPDITAGGGSMLRSAGYSGDELEVLFDKSVLMPSSMRASGTSGIDRRQQRDGISALN